ncbi:hypothetical protein B0A81_00130 [Flavobacterium plurextorum]|uniref:Uncharacterized protein n=1 Tax=Flavobacterium plurextorum TaxID=1114867 RepID=A0ABX4D048_9FLAO|nr:hypothetical protein [Flavobacterium plurextorum]OXB11801.1 hypothetical protein B0A81_00130 [Flavobacterium plurextorum]
MSVKIIPLTDHKQYMVNGHLVYKDVLENWTCHDDLSAKEHEAFGVYETLFIKDSVLKKNRSYVLECSNLEFTFKYKEDKSAAFENI